MDNSAELKYFDNTISSSYKVAEKLDLLGEKILKIVINYSHFVREDSLANYSHPDKFYSNNKKFKIIVKRHHRWTNIWEVTIEYNFNKKRRYKKIYKGSILERRDSYDNLIAREYKNLFFSSDDIYYLIEFRKQVENEVDTLLSLFGPDE